MTRAAVRSPIVRRRTLALIEHHLFVYGTLLPGEVRWHFLEPFVVGEGKLDRVRGILSDTRQGYPAASFDVPLDSASMIVGRVFGLVDEGSAEALAQLDEVEGAVAGLYRRVEVTTERGIVCWAYEYGGGLDLVAIEGGSWLERRQSE